ncbi:MAG: hypothetical protein WDO74_16615 [Pseudomonadota bacterium]
MLGLFALLPLLGCSHPEDLIVQTGAGKEPSAIDLDKEPLALLPGGVVGIASVDATQLVASPLLAAACSPCSTSAYRCQPSAGFDPARDLQRLYVGLYTMQGADLSGEGLGQNSTRPRLRRP